MPWWFVVVILLYREYCTQLHLFGIRGLAAATLCIPPTATRLLVVNTCGNSEASMRQWTLSDLPSIHSSYSYGLIHQNDHRGV